MSIIHKYLDVDILIYHNYSVSEIKYFFNGLNKIRASFFKRNENSFLAPFFQQNTLPEKTFPLNID